MTALCRAPGFLVSIVAARKKAFSRFLAAAAFFGSGVVTGPTHRLSGWWRSCPGTVTVSVSRSVDTLRRRGAQLRHRPLRSVRRGATAGCGPTGSTALGIHSAHFPNPSSVKPQEQRASA